MTHMLGQRGATLADVARLLQGNLEARLAADSCTDPDNCKRCRTMLAHRGDMQHAGIPADNRPKQVTHPEDV